MDGKATPLYSALCALADQDGLRFHMPGHKGRGVGSALDGAFAIDYTEIPCTGNLYGEGGVIQQAEALAAAYWGMDRCFFLTCGATQGIKAAMAAFCHEGDAVVIDRNCHQSAFDACAMLGLSPRYIWPALDPASGLSGDIEAEELTHLVKASGARAVLVTSPTYYGKLLDIASLVRAAHAAGAALIVDGAHGSHLRACGIADPAAQGADGVIFSAHKTLSALGQGAYLLARGQSEAFYHRLRRATALFGTTSPSYPIMASLDLARARLWDGGGWPQTARLCREIGLGLEPFGLRSPAPGTDPCRLTVDTAAGGLRGDRAADRLRAAGIEPEMADERHVVLIVTPQDTRADLEAVAAAFAAMPRGAALAHCHRPLPRPEVRLTPRQAYFSATQALPLSRCIGRIAAQNIAPYPPGVPVLTYGEVIDEISVEYLLQKGYNELDRMLVTL